MDKFIDGVISVLKKAGASDLFLGIFVVAEGFVLIFARDFFPIMIILSICMAFAFVIEWLVDVIRQHRHTTWNIFQRILAILALIALAVYCGLMIFNDQFRLNVDRVLVCATTVMDGVKNLFHTIKIEKQPKPRKIFITFSAMYIAYGVAYGFLGGGDVNFFNTTMHGVVFILCGLTNIWLVYRGYRSKKRMKKDKVAMTREI